MSSPINPKKSSRLLSLDVFRGFTIALMILVNSPGNQNVYSWLEHSHWNGCSLADLVFPFFIFIVGVSTVFSLNNTSKKKLVLQAPKILRRTLIIFGLGLLLNAFPYHFDLESLRFYGVLQRIALCYLFTTGLFLTTTKETQGVLMVLLLIGYWMLLLTAPLTPENNLAAQLDRYLFNSKHLYGKFYDPEGLLSTIPSVATALLGNLTGFWLLSVYKKNQKCLGLSLVGVLALILGWVWSYWFPFNKTLWTSSYVLWTGGWALLTLALFYWLIDIKGWKKWSKPFEIFGVNALAVYFLHVLFIKIQFMIPITLADGSSQNLKYFLTKSLFFWASAYNASLLYAITYTLLWLGVCTLLYRKKIFIKI